MSLKTKSIALVATCFVIILAASFFLLEILSNDIRSGLATMYAKEQTNYSRAKVLHPLMRELGLALKLADSTTIRNWSMHETDAAARTAALRELEDYRRFFTDRSFFFAIKDSGHYYFNDRNDSYQGAELRYTLNPESPEDYWFYRTLASGQDYALNVDYDEKLAVTKIWINVVVRNAGVPIGIIGTGIDLTEFITSVVSTKQPGVTSIFVEESGAIQAHNQTSQIDFRTISKDKSERKTIFQMFDSPKTATQLKDIFTLLSTGKTEAEVIPARIGGTDYLVGIGAIRDIGWYNITLLDTTTIIGTHLEWPFAVLIFVALLLLSIALIALLNRFVISRISRLDTLSQKLAKGADIDFPNTQIQDEMGRLEYSFEQMATSLKQQAKTLENRVEERTRELAEKNIQLNQALSEIKTLSGLLPICMYCKEIRNDKGAWTRLENYIEEHSEAEFSHGICDKCMQEKFVKKTS